MQKLCKGDKTPQSDQGPALQNTVRQPDEMIGLNPKLREDKDQIVLVKEEYQTDAKPERYVPIVTRPQLTFRFRFHELHMHITSLVPVLFLSTGK